MTISDDEDFNHLANEIFGKGTSPIHLYCIHNKIKLHRKLKAKLKTGDEEYIDPGTGASAKLSEDDIYEINAIPSFKAYMQNEIGPKKACPLDITITELSRADFTRHLTDDYDEDNTDKYNYQKAQD